MARIPKCACGDVSVIAYEFPISTDLVWYCGLCETMFEPWTEGVIVFELVEEGAFI